MKANMMSKSEESNPANSLTGDDIAAFAARTEASAARPEAEMSKSEESNPIMTSAEAVSKDRERTLHTILRRKDIMVADYKNTIKKTGGLLTVSMAVAYAKGIADTLKLIAKENAKHEEISKEAPPGQQSSETA